jgi:HYDIN/CFA65/VesB-like, Ig-like domain/Secretion system C-terminal sorting domain/PQQ-like domain
MQICKKRYCLALLFLMLSSAYVFGQSLIASYPFPNVNIYNSFWGITQRNDTLWIGSDYNGKIYKVTKTGVIVDSIPTPYSFNHGLGWETNGFWLAEYVRTSGARLFKVNTSGVAIDTIFTGSFAQGIGDIAIDGNNIWYSSYYPDYPSYPYQYAYKVNLTSLQIVDTIPLRGNQTQGITVKGDTIIYVNDNFSSPFPTPERIYAYRRAVGDTLFSFPTPDGDCDPKGLFWDGQYLWLIADIVGGTTPTVLYKYTLTGQGSPQIGTSTNSINFGNVIIGTTSNQPLTIQNTGSAKLIISAFNMTNPRFGITPNNVPDTINPNQSKNYTVTFTPNAYDTTSGQLRISSNDAGTPVKIISLRGKGVQNGSYIALSSNSSNWNTRRVNSLSGFTFSITNQGSQPLQINSVSFSTQRFSFDNTNVTFPVTIDTQKSRTFRIWFNPNSASTFSDTAVISSNAVNLPSANISLTGTGQFNPTALGDIMWQGHTPDNPNTSSQDYQPKSIKRIGDVNADGVNDVVVASENYWTICYNGNASVTADTLWKFNTDFGSINTGSVDWEDAMDILSDINNDGVDEVVIGCGGGNEIVYVISGKTGQKLWEYGNPSTTSDGDIMGLRTDKDYNGDGRKDVLVSASGEANFGGRHAVICLNGLNGQVIFNVTQTSNFTYDVVSTQTGGAIGVGNNGGPYGVNGFNNSGSSLWSYPISGAAWSLKQIPDINGDNIPDIVGQQSAANGKMFAISGDAGAEIWTATLGTSNNGKIILLDDLDKNGFLDIATSGPTTTYRLDSRDGAFLWTVALGASYTRGIDDIGDVNGDTLHEIAVITQQPAILFVLNGKDGTTLFQYTFGTSINERGDRVIAINSIDTNLSKEMVAGSRDGRLICFSGGPNTVIGVKPITENVPAEYRLYQNYPNPFNPVTKIKFDIPKSSHVKLRIFDILGREVAVLADENLKPGKYERLWNASMFASGVYFYEIDAGEYREVKKMILVK